MQLPLNFVLALRHTIFDRYEVDGVATYTVKTIGANHINYNLVARKTWAVHGICLTCGKKFFKARCKTCEIDYDPERRGWHGEMAVLSDQYRMALEFMRYEGFWPIAQQSS